MDRGGPGADRTIVAAPTGRNDGTVAMVLDVNNLGQENTPSLSA